MSSMEQPIRNLKKAERIPQGTTYVASMGDGSGTALVSQELLEKEVEEKVSVDVLDTQEEIEANTNEGKAAGALAVKEMVSELNDNLKNKCLGLPDYENRRTFSSNSFTPNTNGYIYIGMRANTGRYMVIKVNNIVISSTYAPAATSSDGNVYSPLIPVRKGDAVEVSFDYTSAGGQGYQTSRYFVPEVSI